MKVRDKLFNFITALNYFSVRFWINNRTKLVQQYFALSLMVVLVLITVVIPFGIAWGQFHSPESIGRPGTVAINGIGAFSWGINRVDVVVVGGDRTLYHRWYDPHNPGWSTTTSGSPFWENLGTPPAGAAGNPAVTSWGINRLDVFVRGQDNVLYHRWHDPRNIPPGWSGWEPFRVFCSFGDPAAVSWDTNRIDVFIAGTNCVPNSGPSGDIQHKWYDNGWGTRDWSRLTFSPPEFFHTPIAVSTWGTNRLDLFTLGSADGQIYHTFCEPDCNQ